MKELKMSVKLAEDFRREENMKVKLTLINLIRLYWN